MNNLWYYVIIFVLSYLAGAIPFGLLIGFMYGKDVRQEGSGNIGATNVTRVVGAKAGKVCFFLDFIKGFAPVLIVSLLISHGVLPDSGYVRIIAAVAPVLGHMFPVFLKFKGGKGVSTAAGAVLGLSPLACIAGLLVWAVVFTLSRYVSLASIVAAIIVPIVTFLLNAFGYYKIPGPTQVFLALLCLLAILRHKENIVKLCKGTENRFSRK